MIPVHCQDTGPVGRFVRLAFGALCLWYMIRLIPVVGNLFDSDGHIRQVVWNGIIIGLFLATFVIVYLVMAFYSLNLVSGFSRPLQSIYKGELSILELRISVFMEHG
jgi:hypothetical protein